MRRIVLSIFLFAAIIGLGCMGVAVPGNADEHCEDTSHPQYDESECEGQKVSSTKKVDITNYNGHRRADAYSNTARRWPADLKLVDGQ